MSFSQRVILGLGLGIAVGVFLGEMVAPLKVVADGFVRLLQMTVLPYVVLSITSNLGKLTYAQARSLGLRVGAALLVLWGTAILYTFLFPLTFPPIETAAFFSPTLIERANPFDYIELYVPSNPFASLANNVVPAVVLFSVLLGLALIGVERKHPLLDVLDAASDAVGRVTRFVVRLTPYGIFAIAAHAAGTLSVVEVTRVGIYLVAYVAFALLLALWVLPGLVSALTPFSVREILITPHEALLTAFVVGDLFIVLPSLIEACSSLIEKRINVASDTRDLPGSIIPMSFTFPHSGKLLSLSFVLFAGWMSDSAVRVADFPQLALSGFFSFFGSLNAAVPFLLDLFRIPADTFQLFLATGVINSRFGTLLAAVHTVAVGLLGSAAIAGAMRIRPRQLVRYLVITAVLSAITIVGLRTVFANMLIARVDSRAVVFGMEPLTTAAVDDRTVKAPADVPDSDLPPADGMLAAIRTRGVLRVGLIAEGIPYAYRNDRGELVGFDIEMAESLASDLGVKTEYVRFLQPELNDQVHRRTVDIVMTGARVTPERSAAFITSEPYLDETLAIVTPDYRRDQFRSWAAIRQRPGLRIGVQNLPYYMTAVRALLPRAQLEVIPETRELIDPDAPFDAYILPAERGSVLTMLNPRFSVVVPEGDTVRMPLAYPIAGDDPAWTRYVNTWIGMKKRDGFVQRLYDHWILGQAAVHEEPRWSVIRNVLHWVP
jgi:Na+/H+-dicarboxylate symporter/ABC-type amino acid transport substrate-binding protein